MGRLGAAIRIGLLDIRGDLPRFVLLVVCLAVGTALIAGVNSVGASITQAIDTNAAALMGGDLELSRADRPATAAELEQMSAFGKVSSVVDTNVRAEVGDRSAFVDLTAVGEAYPLLGKVTSRHLPEAVSVYDFLAVRDGLPGALVDPLMLDQLGISVGDSFDLGGTPFQARGALTNLPDSPVRGFRLGLTAVISGAGLALVSDRTSPLPGLGTWFRYKLLLNARQIDAIPAELTATFAPAGWAVRTARDGLGAMVRYYDLFMRFLVIVGLGSLVIGGISVWTGMRSYIAERASLIAILRSIGAGRSRIFVHFFTQVAALALVGVGLGLAFGGGAALVVLPLVGEAVGIPVAATLHAEPLLIAAGAGLVTAFAFSYLPLQQAQSIRPILLFRSKGMAAPPLDWGALLRSWQLAPLVLAVVVFFWLAWLMTNDVQLVAAVGGASVLAAVLLQFFVRAVQSVLRRVPGPRQRTLRHALRAIAAPGSHAASIVVAIGMALTMLNVVLVLQGNLRQEFLGASAFDVPTFVAADLFPDEVEIIAAASGPGTNITHFVATPMLRGMLTEINGTPVEAVRTHGPEATFLLSGEVPLTFRRDLPAASELVAGEWWPASGPATNQISLHESLRSGLGVEVGDTLTFSIFGESVTAAIANFRDYSWQNGLDFLVSFAPGVLDEYPMTLFAAVSALPGREETVERALAADLPDVRFIAIGDTLTQITIALGQLSLAALLVGGIAVGNGLLVLAGSLATARRQREIDTVIGKVLGATRVGLLATAATQYLLLAVIAVIPASVLGIGLAWLVSLPLLDVSFTVDTGALLGALLLAVATTILLGVITILRAASAPPARLLRELQD